MAPEPGRTQLALFGAPEVTAARTRSRPEEPDMLEELRRTDVDQLTPLAALNLVSRWKGRL